MTSPSRPEPSPTIRFPRFTDFGDLNSLSIVIQDLSLTYDVTAVTILPGYGRVRMPTTRFGPRRWSLLEVQDRLKLKRVSLASPLEIAFDTTGISLAISGVALAANRVLVAVKAFTDVLAAGVDIHQREQALEENRELAPERLRQANLSNDLLEQQVRRAAAEADLIERARDEILGLRPPPEDNITAHDSSRGQRTVGALASAEIAELLDEPIRRILGYCGGELEVYGDDR
jgi:hypothetical protein